VVGGLKSWDQCRRTTRFAIDAALSKAQGTTYGNHYLRFFHDHRGRRRARCECEQFVMTWASPAFVLLDVKEGLLHCMGSQISEVPDAPYYNDDTGVVVAIRKASSR